MSKKSFARSAGAAALTLALSLGLVAPAAADDALPPGDDTVSCPAAPGDPTDACILASATPVIAGVAAVGSTLSADAGTWTAGATLTYQWYADGVAITDATASTLPVTSGMKDKSLTVAVSGELEGYTSPPPALSAPTPKVIAPATPQVTGKAIVGTTLVATAGTWTNGTKLTYQWYADDAPISGATKSSYTIPAALSGTRITVVTTGSKTGYATASAASSTTAFVMRPATPTISGQAGTSLTLTAKTGTWTTGAAFTYQWYADGKAISGATKSTLSLKSAQKAKKITVKVTGSKSGHPTVSKTSAATSKVATTGTPSVSGTALYGSTLTAKGGTWTSGTKLTYQWYANGTAISGATTSTLKLTGSHKNKTITVKVTGKKSGYATAARTSASTKKVATAAKPTISGTKKITYTLTAKPGTWTTGATLSYQWYANGKAISGAKKSTLKLTSSMAGKKITVKVTGKKSGYPTVSKTSSATAAIGYPSRTTPNSSGSCPAWAPIKGNQNSKGEWIYHVPGGRSYKVTNPEECFRTESAARAAGYRAPKN